MDEDTKLKCEIVTPEGLILDEFVEMAVVPGAMGELGILPRHAPIVSRTVVGEVRVKPLEGDWEYFAVGNGYVKVHFDRLLLLADTAERASDIELARSEAAIARAEELLAKYRSGEAGVDVHRAEQSRKRALNRLKVSGRV